MRYLPHTATEVASMLKTIGVPTIDALFDAIPKSVRLGRPLELPNGIDEITLMRELDDLAQRNRASSMLSFLGGGIYDHHIPPAADQLLLRGEFYTAYTPYQAEVAQGTLQAVFEYQTIVAELFGMPAANASMYDGATAAVEAVLMARRLTKRNGVAVSAGVHPETIATLKTYVRSLPGGVEAIETAPLGHDGCLDSAWSPKNWSDIACVVVGYPNVFGCIGDLTPIVRAAHEHGALVVTVCADPYAMALLKPPGELDVDIAVGEGQPLGVSMQYGGPGCGLFACRDSRAFLQNIPGRIVGETVDADGQRGYVLTLSTREQHIRRERATSNICTNHSLCALAIAIRMSMLGKRGFVEVAEQCLAKTEYLKRELVKTGAWELPYSAPTFNEFVIKSKRGPVAPTLKNLENEGILAGIPLSRWFPNRDRELLIAVTERHTRADLDKLVAQLS